MINSKGPVSVLYFRYGQLEIHFERYWTIREAQKFLYGLEEGGSCYGVGIMGNETKTLYVPENMDIAGKDREQVLRGKLEALKGKFEIDKIEYYKSEEELEERL